MSPTFISYRHESDAHRQQVRALAERLEAAGIDIVLDQFADERLFSSAGPNEGWPRWSKNQAKEPHRVIIIGSAGWFRCFEGKEVPGKGLGSAAEAGVIEQRLYNTAGVNADIRIAHFGAYNIIGLPIDLQRYHVFQIDRDEAKLIAWLKGTAPTTAMPAASAAWPDTTPALHWPLADHDKVRDAFATLITRSASHRGLLVKGPSGRGKTTITEHLLANAFRMSGIACGRFDFKGGSGLGIELERFSDHLGIPAPKTSDLCQGLSEILRAVNERRQPTLMLFDTFEQAGAAEDWLQQSLMMSLLRHDHLRVVIAGQTVLPTLGKPWATAVLGPLELGDPTPDDWFTYGVTHKPGLTLDFVRQAHQFASGNAKLLAQLLGNA